MSLPRPEHYNGFIIDYTIVDYANGIIQWQIENEDGEILHTRCSATESDARNDAQAFIGQLIEASK